MDRYPQKDFTLNKYYFTIDKEESDRQIKNLKRRMCHVNSKKLALDIEERKKKTFLN
jgi:hypothetical protein